MHASAARVSVVIPTRDRCVSLRRLLSALRRQTLAPELFEVLVCDDGSVDATSTIAREFATTPVVRVVSSSGRGRASACNAGIRVCSGDLVVLLDDDMEPAPGCLAAHLNAHAEASPTVVLGPVPIAYDSSSTPVARYIGHKFEGHLRSLARPGRVIGFRDFYSGNCSIRRAVLLDVGLFDEEFTAYGNEDGELAVRLIAAGVAPVFEPAAVAYQHYEKDFRRLARDTSEKGRTAVLLSKKHPQTFEKLALAKYDSAPIAWQLIRGMLLAATRTVPHTRAWVASTVSVLERWMIVPNRWYEVALDYFYWVGATIDADAGRR